MIWSFPMHRWRGFISCFKNLGQDFLNLFLGSRLFIGLGAVIPSSTARCLWINCLVHLRLIHPWYQWGLKNPSESVWTAGSSTTKQIKYIFWFCILALFFMKTIRNVHWDNHVYVIHLIDYDVKTIFILKCSHPVAWVLGLWVDAVPV